MRTTLTLDPDVAAKARKGAARLHKPFKEVINAALRVGLDAILKPPAAKPYRTTPRPMGLRAGFNYDNISELIAAAEHNCVLCSTDADFSRFRGLKWKNPLAE